MAFIIDDIIGGVVRHQDLMRLKARPRFETTEYGKYLQGVGQKGAVDVDARLGGYARDVYGGAAEERSRYLAGARRRMGTSGSIAFERGANDIGMQAVELVGRQRENLESLNEESRRRAQEAYAMAATEWNEQRRREKEEIDKLRRSNITGSLLSAGKSALAIGAGAALGGAGLLGKGVSALRGGVMGAATGLGGVAGTFLGAPEANLTKQWRTEDREMMLAGKRQQADIAERQMGLEEAKFDFSKQRQLFTDEDTAELERVQNEMAGTDDPKMQMFIWQEYLNKKYGAQ